MPRNPESESTRQDRAALLRQQAAGGERDGVPIWDYLAQGQTRD
jgi:hypothetical protein